MTSSRVVGQLDRADLVVVGAGIVGLAHAVQAVAHGLSVVLVERDDRAVGASVRNFGHGCLTAQDGEALRYATRAREVWIDLAKQADFWLRECGTVVLARHQDELAVLEDLRALRGDDVIMLDAVEVARRVPVGPDVVGGAWLPRDLRLDPRAAVPAITRWLQERGVRFHWRTSLLGVDDDGVDTSRGRVDASRTVVAVGHDVDRIFPTLAAETGIVRCSLHMLQVANPTRNAVDPAVFSGWSMLRYPAFARSPALESVRARLTAELPAGVEHGLNLMLTQRPDGDLTVGDTHSYGITPSPFQAEELDDLILGQVAALLGVGQLTVRARWQGVYASADQPFLVAAPFPHVRAVSVTSGIGMTTGLGLGAEVVDDLI